MTRHHFLPLLFAAACGGATADVDADETTPTGIVTDTDAAGDDDEPQGDDDDTPVDTGDDTGNDTDDATDDDTALTACTLGPPADRHYTLDLPFEGKDRNALVDLPDDYDGSEMVPLVLNFHGLATTASNQKSYTGMAGAGNARGWIVVHPNGTNRSWDYVPNSQDVRFVDALIDELATDLCIDERRIYLTGLSNGGFFSYQFACDRGDRVAAIAPVAGMQTDPFCNPGTKVPVLHIHGDDDSTVQYDGGLLYPSAQESVEGWAEDVNDCDTSPAVLAEIGDVICEQWSCSAVDEATLCTVHGGGHTWPGALPVPFLGETNQDIDATEEILDFFSRWTRP